MSALAAELGKHVDAPGTRHRLVLTSANKLRCLDCTQTLDLRPALAAVPGTTSTSRTIPTPEQSCRRHPGEWPTSCGRCRSERLERPDEAAGFVPTADVERRAAEAREALRRTEEPA